jgi:hypothetical protein
MIILRLVLTLLFLLPVWLAVDTQTVTSRTSQHPHTVKRPAPRTVYVSICESRSAYAYHRSRCRGLARCTHGLSQMTVAQAQNVGYVPCKICY